jgi:hypothetical protein
MKRFLNWIFSFVPRKLPTGMTSFNSWVASIVELSGLPSNDTTRKLAATFILRVPTTIAFLSHRTISNQLIKAAANQVAAEVLKGDVQAIKKEVV